MNNVFVTTLQLLVVVGFSNLPTTRGNGGRRAVSTFKSSRTKVLGLGRLARTGLAAAGLGAAMLPDAAAAQVPRMAANALWRTVGVDTQMGYTDGAYAQVEQVISDLHYLGVCNVRDGITNGFDPITGQWNGSAQIATYQSLASACMRFTFVFAGGGAITPQFLQSQFSLMLQVESFNPGSINGFETFNEFNNFNMSWNGDTVTSCGQEVADVLAAQSYAFAMIRSVASLNKVPVIMATGFDAWDTALNCAVGDSPNIARVKGLANWTNAHPYPWEGAPPGLTLDRPLPVPGQTRPGTFTEWGYSSSGTGNSGVNEDVQMRYGLDGLLDAGSSGTRSYMFSLLDAYAPNSRQGDQYFGLFDYTGAPKPLAVAIHNMHDIVRDTGNPQNLLLYPSFSLSGMPSSGSAIALGRHDGSVMEAIWAEPPLWNFAGGTEYPIALQLVTVSLGQQFPIVQVFDPTKGREPIQTLTNVSQVDVALGASPLFIKAE